MMRPTRSALPGKLVEEFESLDEPILLSRDPGSWQPRYVIEGRPGLKCLRQAEASSDRFDDQLASGIGLEVIDRGEEIRTQRAQALRAIERRLNAGVTLVREADDERKMPGDAVLEHAVGGVKYLLDADVLANALEHLVRAGLDADQ